jgi:NAD-dependent dihydropyrimidine dehydrogenase PreA subunit
MGLFISVLVDKGRCNLCKKCQICPVDIFKFDNDIQVVDEDECLLCNACIEACETGAITIQKEYGKS